MVIVVGHQVRILCLLLIILDHWLYIRKHVLALSKALIFLLTLLYRWHATIVPHYLVARSVVLFVATRSWLNPVHPFKEATTSALFWIPFPLVVCQFFLLFLIAAVISLLSLFVSNIMSWLVTTILKSLHLALQFGEMELQVLVHFSHLKELLFVVLSRYFLGL